MYRVWVKKMTFMDDLVVSENGGILQVPKSPLVSKWSNDLDDLGVAPFSEPSIFRNGYIICEYEHVDTSSWIIIGINYRNPFLYGPTNCREFQHWESIGSRSFWISRGFIPGEPGWGPPLAPRHCFHANTSLALKEVMNA